MDSIKVTNRGNNIKSTGKEAWESEFTWNKFNDKCAVYPEGAYYASAFHSAGATSDTVYIVSKSGFKNTGLNNGENHIKCYYSSGTR